MSFWRRLPHDRDATPTPDEAGQLLSGLHEALAGLDVDLPLLAPLNGPSGASVSKV